MNICIINIDNKPEFIGGIKRVSSILGKEWKAEGHQVYFITHCTSDIRYPEIASIPQYFFPDTGCIDSLSNLAFFIDFIKNKSIDIILNQFADINEMSELCFKTKLQTGKALVSAIHFSPTYKKDIIRNSFFIPYKLGNKAKRYIIDCLLFCKFWLYTNPHNEKIEEAYFNRLYNQSDKLVLLSKKFKPIFTKKANLTDISRLIAINNPASFTDNALTVPKENLVVWCGRLGFDTKRTDKMLSIWRKITNKYPEWKLIILGSGDSEYFNNIIRIYNIANVEIVGFCNPDKYYKKASILCMTSVTEGWGMVLIEAQAYNCVPIAFNSYASLTDIITDGENGFIVPPFNEKEYIRKLSTLMENPTLRLKMAENGLKSIERFNTEKIAKEWINEFKEIIQK